MSQSDSLMAVGARQRHKASGEIWRVNAPPNTSGQGTSLQIVRDSNPFGGVRYVWAHYWHDVGTWEPVR